MKLYQSLAHQLRSAGIDAVFGVMGDGNMHWLAEYCQLPGAVWYPAWHEAGAVGMADGYATAASKADGPVVGVVTVTMGPGVAQTLAALTAAVRTRSRLLMITAEPDHVAPRNIQDVDQLSWVASAGAAYRLLTEPGDLSSVLAETLASARAGQPSVLSVPLSLMTKDVVDTGEVHLLSSDIPTAGADPRSLQIAADLLAGSQRPLVLVGRGAVSSRAVQASVDIARKIGACLLTTVQAKGCLTKFADPFDLGLTGTMAHPFAHAIAAEADVVLIVGAALDGYNTNEGSFFGNARLIQIDCRPPSQFWQPRDDTVNITADAAKALALLRPILPPATWSGLRTPQTSQLIASEPPRRAALNVAQQNDGLNPWAVVAEIDNIVGDTVHIVTGVGHFWYFVAPNLTTRGDRTFHFGYGFGLIGQGVPLATGAAVALLKAGTDRPVVLIEGDGSFLMNSQEIQSAARFGADLLVLVFNNEGYGSEIHKLGIAGLDPLAGAFPYPVDITGLARALGAVAQTVRTLGELRSALTDFTSRGGVRVLDIVISRSVMSEAYERMHLPKTSTKV